MTANQIIVSILTDSDIIIARQQARDLAKNSGFTSSELAVIATAISELARNIISYATRGQVTVRLIDERSKKGVIIIAEDSGPGIADIHQAMQEGFSTSNSLGLGLPGVRRLMDFFDIQSQSGKGTRVTIKKWALS